MDKRLFSDTEGAGITRSNCEDKGMNISDNFPQPARYALAQFPIAMNDGVEYSSAAGAACASGRFNLIGKHTDYNDGFVLPIAVDRVVAFAARVRGARVLPLLSTPFQE